MVAFVAHSVAECPPPGLVRIEIGAVNNYGFQQSRKGIGESATAIGAEDVRVLMNEDGESLGKIGLKNLGREKHFSGGIAVIVGKRPSAPSGAR